MSRCIALAARVLVCSGNRDIVTADWGPNHHDYLLYVALSDGTRHGRGRHLAGDTLRSTLCGLFALTANMSAVCCIQCAGAICWRLLQLRRELPYKILHVKNIDFILFIYLHQTTKVHKYQTHRAIIGAANCIMAQTTIFGVRRGLHGPFYISPSSHSVNLLNISYNGLLSAYVLPKNVVLKAVCLWECRHDTEYKFLFDFD